jgi:hypothetical protein
MHTTQKLVSFGATVSVKGGSPTCAPLIAGAAVVELSCGDTDGSGAPLGGRSISFHRRTSSLTLAKSGAAAVDADDAAIEVRATAVGDATLEVDAAQDQTLARTASAHEVSWWCKRRILFSYAIFVLVVGCCSNPITM